MMAGDICTVCRAPATATVAAHAYCAACIDRGEPDRINSAIRADRELRDSALLESRRAEAIAQARDEGYERWLSDQVHRYVARNPPTEAMQDAELASYVATLEEVGRVVYGGEPERVKWRSLGDEYLPRLFGEDGLPIGKFRQMREQLLRRLAFLDAKIRVLSASREEPESWNDEEWARYLTDEVERENVALLRTNEEGLNALLRWRVDSYGREANALRHRLAGEEGFAHPDVGDALDALEASCPDIEPWWDPWPWWADTREAATKGANEECAATAEARAVVHDEFLAELRDPLPGDGEPAVLTGRDAEIVRMWKVGSTAAQIAKQYGVERKTIANRIGELRRIHGDNVVPRRRPHP